ncbi:hypothetical protein KC346_g19548, partial [Hortaea werneckii]
MDHNSRTPEHRSNSRNGPGHEVDGVQQPPARNDHRRSMKELLPSLKQRWTAVTGIDRRTYMQMFKGALAPTVAIAAYQATSYADMFTTIGYLVGVMAVLSFPIQPRAKFLQTMLVNLLTTCLGC